MANEKEISADEKTAVEQFFEIAEGKTKNSIHHRLLKAAKDKNPTPKLETELRQIILDIVHENKNP